MYCLCLLNVARANSLYILEGVFRGMVIDAEDIGSTDRSWKVNYQDPQRMLHYPCFPHRIRIFLILDHGSLLDRFYSSCYPYTGISNDHPSNWYIKAYVWLMVDLCGRFRPAQKDVLKLFTVASVWKNGFFSLFFHINWPIRIKLLKAVILFESFWKRSRDLIWN